MTNEEKIKLLRFALNAMLDVSLKVDDKEWARAVERTPNVSRPCDMAVNAMHETRPENGSTFDV